MATPSIETAIHTLSDFESALSKKGLIKNKKEDKIAYSDIAQIWNLLTGKTKDITKIKTPSTWDNFEMKVRKITVHNKPAGAITLIVETFSAETARSKWQESVNTKLTKIFGKNSVSLSNPVVASQSKSSRATRIELSTHIQVSTAKKTSFEPIEIYLIFKDPTEKVVVNKKGELDITVVPAKMGIAGVWLTPQEMAKQAKDYFSKIIYQGKPLPQQYIDEFHGIIDESLSLETTINYNVRQSKDMAFFAEILCAIKLARLFQNPKSKNAKPIFDAIKFNEPEQSDYMKIIEANKRNIKIKLPIEMNYSLLDYFLSYNGKEEESSSLKVSVKSKLSSSTKVGKEASGATNTIKFDDVFDNLPINVLEWYKQFQKSGLSQAAKEQFGPKVIAYKSITAKEIGVGGLYPIQALSLLLRASMTSQEQTDQILPVLKRFGQKITNFSEILVNLEKMNKKDKSKYSEERVVQAYKNAFIEVGQLFHQRNTLFLKKIRCIVFKPVCYFFYFLASFKIGNEDSVFCINHCDVV